MVAARDDEILPLQERIESIADEADLEDVYDTERHLLVTGHYEPWLRNRVQCGGGSW